MAKVEWIKILTGMFDDEKIKLIEDTPEADMVLIIWIKLLTLAGKKNQAGYIFLTEKIPYTDEMLSTIFKRPLNIIRLALDTFRRLEMIETDDSNVTKVINWEKHQNIEGLERIREQTKLRVRKFRKSNKSLPKLKSNVTETQGNETDKIRIEEIREEKKDIKESGDSSSGKSKTKDNDPLEFSFEDKCWWGLYDWRIKMYQGAFPILTINYLFNDKWKTKFLEDPKKYKKIIKEKYEGKIEKLVWAWLMQAKKYYIKDHPGYKERG